ncbi:intradiol ring-cleavage dioxygenase [Sphingomonadales bacterium 56]|uniref:Hydroxyquinol 1,2-dioxygenase n=1 Tax=Sphingobium indicum TaxID=332055 RepID=A0A4Q4ITB8_9SPHN|nr:MULTISPECIES: intradiol ring-cleavage dioxygenase [Sphingobium]MBY2930692.1 intradiol ring-cleavage dioxygenase [Sphingomonadales bacterium 56]MBY2960766.1 intradiol ring-cleavage dioxygenase [Sphingomonadales bacterium 58]NYI24996.1 hydroxyquinol 1,2-dioxygenase [Sphingobium indicum]RYL96728.1 hydroxyquinol 1,2-dioxygenase [Sphingobium indicum]CAD7341769.1 Hydroxyquinol 1,2-dioxygenase [Sphingobium sp. S6]
MRDITEASITDAVRESFDKASDPRLKQLLQSLVSHLHAFVKEVEPTTAEWSAAIDFLTRTGHICDDRRQEFILLSDTLGVSVLVDLINHRMPVGATDTTVLGPFYVANPPAFPLGADICNGMTGKPMYCDGRIQTPDGKPLGGATVDVWQCDGDGYYDIQLGPDHLGLRARLTADQDGRFSFWSVVPSHYPIPDDGPVGDMLGATGRHPYRPAHVHFMIQHPGYETLVTHIFLEGSEYLESDTVFDVKTSLVTDVVPHEAGTAPDGSAVGEPWGALHFDFGLKPLAAAPRATLTRRPAPVEA